MLSKGLDFDKLMLVGVIQVDYMLNIPDFRAHEKCFQIITQLCGRVGRKEKQGLAIIQSTNLKNQIIKQIKNFNYNDFFESEIVERSKFGYPPFYCLIKVTFASSDFELTKESSVIFFNSIKHSLKGVKVLFPSIGYPAKLRSDFIFNLWIKIPKNYNGIALNSLKLHINETRNSVNREKKLRNVKIIFDVDPI
jgi:primosomal protein N' (replication factor Y)